MKVFIQDRNEAAQFSKNLIAGRVEFRFELAVLEGYVFKFNSWVEHKAEQELERTRKELSFEKIEDFAKVN